MSVVLFVGPKCTLAALHAPPWGVTFNMLRAATVRKRRDRQTEGQTDGLQTVTLHLPL